MEIEAVTRQMKINSYRMASLDIAVRNKALMAIRDGLEKNSEAIFKANIRDIEQAKMDNVSPVLLNRLLFNEKKLKDVMKGIEQLIELPDPLNKVQLRKQLDSDLILLRESCPIGVIAVIFEARPDALVQIATLCIKSGNCVVLKGGSEAKRTNKEIFDIVNLAASNAGIPDNSLFQIEERYDVNKILNYSECIDLIIPRGSNEFVKYIIEHSKIPVMGHAEGICHIYADKDMDIEKGVEIMLDSKVQYPAACNSAETILVHKHIAKVLLPSLLKRFKQAGVLVKGSNEVRKLVDCELAEDKDFGTEFSDLIIAIDIVNNIDEAIEHINKYGSHHTDCIITENKDNAEYFMKLVDSSGVFCNCSTRFADGYRYGFGAEVGISTGKLHARGPVGLEGLVIYKYKLYGNGNLVSDYADGKKQFHFKDMNL